MYRVETREEKVKDVERFVYPSLIGMDWTLICKPTNKQANLLKTTKQQGKGRACRLQQPQP